MKDYYLSDLADETGELFGYWAEHHMNMDAMITCYLNSHFRENIDKRYAKFCTQTWQEMAEHFEKIPGEQPYDSMLCEWLGYFYTYLQGYTKMSSRELIDKYPFRVMYPRSNVLHDLDMELAIKKVVGR